MQLKVDNLTKKENTPNAQNDFLRVFHLLNLKFLTSPNCWPHTPQENPASPEQFKDSDQSRCIIVHILIT